MRGGLHGCVTARACVRACVRVGFCVAVSRAGGFTHAMEVVVERRFVAVGGIGLHRPWCIVHRSYGVLR